MYFSHLDTETVHSDTLKNLLQETLRASSAHNKKGESTRHPFLSVRGFIECQKQSLDYNQ